MHLLRTLLPFVLPLLLLVACAAHGQEMVFTQPEVANYSLPTDIRIQAAAQIGSTRLAVWGTTVRLPDSAGSPRERPVLVWQMLNGTTPIGQPQPLHDSTTRPSTLVSVIAGNSTFVVIWQDATMPDGRYLLQVRSIGRDGTAMSSVQTLDTIASEATVAPLKVLGGRDQLRFLWTVSAHDTTTIFWNEYQSASDVWSSTESIDTIIGTFRSGSLIQQYSTLQGSAMVRVRGLWRFVDVRGALDARIVPARMIGAQISADSSAILAAENGIALYHNFFEDQPDSIVPVVIDSGLTDPVWHEGGRLAGRTSDGRWMMIRCGESIATGPPGDTLDLWRSQSIQQTDGTWQILAVEKTRSLFSATYTDRDGNRLGMTYHNVRTVLHTSEICGNRIALSGQYSYYASYGGGSTTLQGKVLTIVGPITTDSAIPPMLRDCIEAPPGVLVTRLQNDTLSAIQVAGTTLATGTASIPRLELNAYPELIVIGDTLCWTTEHPSDRISVNNWPSSIAQSPDHRYYAPLRLASLSLIANEIDPRLEVNRAYDGYYIAPGMAALRSWAMRIYSVQNSPHNEDRHTVGIAMIVAAVPDRTGMRTVYNAGYYSTYPSLSSSFPPPAVCSSNPLVSTRAVMVESEHDGQAIAMLTRTRSIICHTKRTIPNTLFAVFDSATVLGGTRDSAFLYRITKDEADPHLQTPVPVLNAWAWQESGTWRQMQADVGHAIISVAADTGARTVVVRRYGLNGSRRDSIALSLPTMPASLTIAVRPSDSSVSLVYERNGVRITRLDRKLRLLSFDSLISTATDSVRVPQALWWRDTLRVVWQDNHRIIGGVAGRKSDERALGAVQGYGTICGRSLPLPQVHLPVDTPVDTTAGNGGDGDTAESREAQHRIRTFLQLAPGVPVSPPGDYLLVSPQPARDQVHVDFFLLSDPARRIVLVDLFGRVVMEHKVEGYPRRGTLQLDCTGIPAGSYRLVLSTPTRLISTPLILE